ncbi:uncharacterized oxidoreductase YjmC isoform X2 [Leptinotarsa decemlineata]|uniref:uncharacterized oxidoreductase YjmC isoform X2 n=1 Tax=Leptinotarsa decemlineata TaxID=7539 RepID=UPI003D30433E
MSLCSRCNSETGASDSSKKIAPLDEVKRFITQCMCAVGVKEDKAEIFADSLVQADYRGINSHGVNRLEHYLKDIKDKQCDGNADPTVAMEAPSTAVVCGNNGFGAVVGKFCMDLAIEKASKTGIGMVVANGSNHFGVGQIYTVQAMNKGFIGFSFTNTSPVMVPTNAKKVALGTNPLSLAAPGENCDGLVVDMSTTAVSLGKIEMYRRRKEKIPEGWALNEQGKMETDPEVAVKAKRLMPLGHTASHKGVGLALIVEVCSGLLSDSKYGPNIRTWGQLPAAQADLGHGFIAINPKNFAPGFEHRLSDLLNSIRKMEPADPKHPVMVPGDYEHSVMKKIDEQGGIIYPKTLLDVIDKLVKELGVEPIKFRS